MLREVNINWYDKNGWGNHLAIMSYSMITNERLFFGMVFYFSTKG